jgi:crotonobetainyl-CoA:carnitine CoA-transferase CaiB-like acyl-CoA transferase
MVVRDPWLSTRHLTSLPFGENGIEFRTHNEPVRMNGRVPDLVRGPRFGEHSEQVLKGLLGLTDEEYQDLLIQEVIY